MDGGTFFIMPVTHDTILTDPRDLKVLFSSFYLDKLFYLLSKQSDKNYVCTLLGNFDINGLLFLRDKKNQENVIDEEKWIEEAIKNTSREDFTSAIRSYSSLLTTYPDDYYYEKCKLRIASLKRLAGDRKLNNFIIESFCDLCNAMNSSYLLIG